MPFAPGKKTPGPGGWSQPGSRSGNCGEEKYILFLPSMELRFFDLPCRSPSRYTGCYPSLCPAIYHMAFANMFMIYFHTNINLRKLRDSLDIIVKPEDKCRSRIAAKLLHIFRNIYTSGLWRLNYFCIIHKTIRFVPQWKHITSQLRNQPGRPTYFCIIYITIQFVPHRKHITSQLRNQPGRPTYFCIIYITIQFVPQRKHISLSYETNQEDRLTSA
jgi:uncharacterized protein YlaI